MKPQLVALLLLGLDCCAGAADQLPYPKPSSFDSSKITRDPFVPIDSLGTADKTFVVESAHIDAAKKFDLAASFRVSSISVSDISVAIINNRAFAEGDSFDMRTEGNLIKRITVLKIKDGSVDLDCAGYRVTVPLLRKEAKPVQE